MKSCAQRKLQCLILVFSIMVTSIASTAAAAGQCKLRKFAELPVTMVDRRPLMTARINDTDVQLIVDSGAFYSFLTEASAAQLKLETAPSPLGPYVDGVHGAAAASITTVKTFALAGGTLHDVEFLVTGGELGHGSVGALGQDFLHLGDAEYDLGHGMIRLMKPENCDKTLLPIGPKNRKRIPRSISHRSLH